MSLRADSPSPGQRLAGDPSPDLFYSTSEAPLGYGETLALPLMSRG